jgi:hypothetical protein
MNFNKVVTSISEEVKTLMFVLQQLQLQREKLDKEINHLQRGLCTS